MKIFFSCVHHSFLKFNIRVYRGGSFTLKSTARQQTYKRKKIGIPRIVLPDMPINLPCPSTHLTH